MTWILTTVLCIIVIEFAVRIPLPEVISEMNGTKLSSSGTSAMRQFIESEEEGWLGIG